MPNFRKNGEKKNEKVKTAEMRGLWIIGKLGKTKDQQEICSNIALNG
jgi:hypothetical protein